MCESRVLCKRSPRRRVIRQLENVSVVDLHRHPWRKQDLRTSVAAALTFVALTGLVTYPQILSFGTSVPYHSDPYFSMWRLGWVAHAIVHAPRALFEANIFYPEHHTLAYSDAMLLPGVVLAPLFWAGLNPVAIYNLALVLAHPAWYEGFGLPPLEAMACGTPVVVSDSSSLPEVVDDAGLIVPAGNPDAWRKALEKVLEDTELAADLRRKGILRAAEFSWRRSAEMTWRVIDETLQAA